jgi:hypothetical protein
MSAMDEDGKMNWLYVVYLISYILIVNWTLLQAGRDAGV